MIAPRDLGILIVGAVTAVSGVLAAVEVNSLPTPSTDATADEPTPRSTGTAPPAAPGDGPGAIPPAIRDVLGWFGGTASVVIDQASLARHVPRSVSDVLTERGAVLVVPPDAEVSP